MIAFTVFLKHCDKSIDHTYARIPGKYAQHVHHTQTGVISLDLLCKRNEGNLQRKQTKKESMISPKVFIYIKKLSQTRSQHTKYIRKTFIHTLVWSFGGVQLHIYRIPLCVAITDIQYPSFRHRILGCDTKWYSIPDLLLRCIEKELFEQIIVITAHQLTLSKDFCGHSGASAATAEHQRKWNRKRKLQVSRSLVTTF